MELTHEQYKQALALSKVPPAVIKETVELLSMWSDIRLIQVSQHATDRALGMSDEELDESVDAAFWGFDQINESDFLTAASVMLGQMHLMPALADIDLVSDLPALPSHRKLYLAYRKHAPGTLDGLQITDMFSAVVTQEVLERQQADAAPKALIRPKWIDSYLMHLSKLGCEDPTGSLARFAERVFDGHWKEDPITVAQSHFEAEPPPEDDSFFW
nr:hypothetical protein [uncultured Roseateles sp.]